MAGDRYTVAETARLLGVSPKRIRQLIAAGTLPTIAGTSPVELPAEAVHRERERRRESPPRPGPEPAPQLLEAQQVLDLAREVASAVAVDSVRLALEAAEPYRRQVEAVRDRTEEALREALAEAEARAKAAEARAEDLAARLAEQEQALAIPEPEHLEEKPRRFWRKKAG